MKKRNVLIIIIFILLINSVSAKEIFSGWKNSGDNFTLEEHLFELEYFKENEKLITGFDGSSIITPLDDCGEKDEFKICLDAADYGDKVKYKLGGIILPGLNLRIYKLGADLTIERSISNSNINLNDKADFDVVIKNTGDKDAENIVYEDIFPDGFIVTNSNLDSFTSSKAKWAGNLLAGKEKKFSYTIQAKDFATFDSIAKISYNNKEIKSSKITIKVNKPYDIETSLTPTTPDLNKDTLYKLEITNTASSDSLEITKLEVKIPKYADFYGYSQEFKREDHKLVFSGDISAGNKKEFEIKIIPNKKAEYNISAIIEMDFGNKKFKDDLSESFGVGVSNVLPIIALKPAVARSFDFVNITAALKNREDENVYVNAKLESTLFKNKQIKNKSISAGSTYNLLTKLITAPVVDKTSHFRVKITGDYISPAGKLLEFDTEQQLKVESREKMAELIQEFDKNTEKGDNLTIDVYVKNLKNQQVDVNLVDTIPRGFLYTGERTTQFTLKRNEKKKAYSYTLTVPQDFKENKFIFTTKLSIKTGEGIYSDIKEAEVMVGKSEEITDEPEEETNDSVAKETEKKEEKELKKPEKVSFFEKIIEFFKGLF